MLSLKNATIAGARPSNKLIDLPREILDLILEYLFVASGGKVSSIVPISITCSRLRNSSYPILFRDVIVLTDGTGLRAKSQAALQQLLTRTHLLKYVRHLHVLTPINEDSRRPSDLAAHFETSVSLLRQSVGHMTGLKQVRLDHLSSLTIQLLQSLVDNTDLRVTFDPRGTKHAVYDRTSIEQCHSIAAKSQWLLDISFPGSKHDFARRTILEFVLASRRVITLRIYQNSPLFQYLITSGTILSGLQELYISTASVESLTLLKSTQRMPWANLQKLQLEGDRQIEMLLPYAVEKMQNLTHLRLRPCRTTVFHKGCTGNMNSFLISEKLPFTRLHKLKHLELFSICNHLTMEQITTPNLRSLRIQLPEYAARLVGLESARSPAEIRWLAKNVPGLERLELHIGDLENLWHPTAIPGVDVDVEVYQFLQALSGFPHLQQLRLFPHYVPRSTRHNFLNAKQPLSDEQAIRIFRHLKSQRPSLDMLSIAATFESLWTFSPMAWTVRNAGDKSILTTRQAGKDYEIEQIWIGERRLSMSNKRHNYHQPYLPDLGDWTYRLSKMPFRLNHPWATEDEIDDGNPY